MTAIVALPHGVAGWSAVCVYDSGISRLFSLTFFDFLTVRIPCMHNSKQRSFERLM